ncbi:hypothetical protein EG329_001359 [Mollisiaceae sp. DMI_Dod_QoI]|nr:hypothetical protein EG329_001359 [Helotiales sp. DMI_Dod_QoI]
MPSPETSKPCPKCKSYICKNSVLESCEDYYVVVSDGEDKSEGKQEAVLNSDADQEEVEQNRQGGQKYFQTLDIKECCDEKQVETESTKAESTKQKSIEQAEKHEPIAVDTGEIGGCKDIVPTITTAEEEGSKLVDYSHGSQDEEDSKEETQAGKGNDEDETEWEPNPVWERAKKAWKARSRERWLDATIESEFSER